MKLPYDFSHRMDKKTEFIVLGDTDSMFINVPSIKPKTTTEAIEKANKIAKDINDLITSFTKNELDRYVPQSSKNGNNGSSKWEQKPKN
jgi:hypothetical protein